MLAKKILILGITGTIGENTIKILSRWPDLFSLVGFSYHKNFELSARIQKKFSVKHVCCTRNSLPEEEIRYWSENGVEVHKSMEDLLDIDYETILTGVVGAAGIKPTYKAVRQGKTVIIANKESLVMAGKFIMKAAEESKALIIPADSEHNSVFRLMQILNQKPSDEKWIKKIYLTASGGPLRNCSVKEIRKAKKEQILKHPTWNMGAKITVDSAGLINKSLEVIEAHYLFNRDYEDLAAVIHPQSYIHAFLKYQDGSFFFHGSDPDMLYPISHSLFYPDIPPDWVQKTASDTMIPSLNFEEIDSNKFPGFFIGLEAAKMEGAYPAVFNASNEEAVNAFLNDQIEFFQIPQIIEKVLEKNTISNQVDHIEELFEADLYARRTVISMI